MNVILSAGKASRLGELAPGGCKALTVVRGRPIIEWQLDVLGEATIVCRSEHVELLGEYGPTVVNDHGRGSADALRSFLSTPREGPVTVVYADSFFRGLPAGEDWVGVADVNGGRSWDLVYKDGSVAYNHLPEGSSGRACVGVYRFSDSYQLALTVSFLTALLFFSDRELGMAPVVNNTPGLRFVDIPSWRDVGDRGAVMAVNERVFP